MQRKNSWTWGAVLAAALALAACSGKGEAELIASAKSYLEKKDPKAAVIELKNALDQNASSAEARFLLGRALLEVGDAAGAEVELKRALDLKHPEAQVVPLRARALLAKGEARRLTEEYGTTDLSDPMQNIELQTTLATAYASRGMMDEARAAVGKALAISPHYAPAVLVNARLTVAGGKVDDALAAIDSLLQRAPDDVEALLFKADLLRAARGDRAAAIDLYRKALAVKPDLAEAHAALITTLLGNGDLDGARAQLGELKKVRPTAQQTQFLEAQIAFSATDFRQARDLIQTLLRAAPENVRALMLAGATELQLGAPSQAESFLSRAAQLAPQSIDARRLLAEAYLRMRQPSKALATLQPLLEMKTPLPQALALAAQAHLLEGDTKTAEALFARAAQMRPDDRRLNAALALSQIARGQADNGFGELQRLAAADEGRSVDMALITARIQRREFDAAMQAIDALQKKQPDSPVPLHLRGRVLVLKQDMDAARKAFEAALAKDDAYVPAVGALAALDMRQGKPDAAQARFAKLIERDPKNVPAMLALAELKQRAGAPAAEVSKAYADAVSAAPAADTQARGAQIDHLTRQRDYKGALAAAQAAVAALPNNVEMLDRLARLQMSTGDRQQALSSYGKIVALRPDEALGYLGQANARMQGEEYDAAIRDVRRAIEKDPDSVPAHRLGIAIAMRQKRTDEALQLARQLQQRRPDDAVGFVAEGEIEASQKRWDASVAALKKGTIKRDGTTAATRLHSVLVAAQRAGEAAKFADAWLKDHPKDAIFLFHLGDAALQTNNMAQAESRYVEVMKMQPENAMALNNVAWLYLRQGKPGARALAEKAVRNAPTLAAARDTYAMVLAAERAFPQAIEESKRALALSGDAPGFRLNLARIYLDAGDKKAARVELDALAKMGDKFPAQFEVERLLKRAEGT
jgi:putative PEP-CTERM system TPR-repeat lipoprotein